MQKKTINRGGGKIKVDRTAKPKSQPRQGKRGYFVMEIGQSTHHQPPERRRLRILPKKKREGGGRKPSISREGGKKKTNRGGVSPDREKKHLPCDREEDHKNKQLEETERGLIKGGSGGSA